MVVPALTASEYSDWPVEGPCTVMLLCKQFSRSNLGPQQWSERFLATARWSDTDRSVHELRSIARYMETGGTHDQVNLAGLAMVEEMEAHSDNPVQPDYEAADYISGRHRESSGIAAELRTHVARLMRDGAEVKRQIGKVRELRGAAAASKGGPAPGKQ